MKIAYVTNLPSHYMLKVFETMSKYYNIEFIFFSDGDERWIEKNNKLNVGNFISCFIKGVRISGHLRINYKLLIKLFNEKYDAYIQYINGPLEILTTFIVAKIKRKPFILWTDLWFQPDSLFHKFSFPVIKYIYRHTDSFVVWGTHVTRFLVSLGVSETKIFYSWGVVDNELFRKPVCKNDLVMLKERYDLEENKVILYVGRLSHEKGIKYLLEAFKLVSGENDVALIIIGHGNEKEYIQKYISENKIKNVHLVDYVPNDELYKYYALADIFVLPSIATKTLREVWGLVINEAMNQKCAVIATNIVGAASGGLIENGKDGIVVEEKNSLAIYHAINDLLNDEKKLEELKTNSYIKIKDWDHNKSFNGFREAIEYVTMRNKKDNEKGSNHL